MSPKKSSKEKRIAISLAVAAVVLFVGAAYFYSAPAPTTANKVQNELLVRPDSQSQGDEKSRVVVVEFLDPECESCSAFDPKLKVILKEYEGRIRFVVRYMPFHGNSLLAATAAEAAARQGKFWEMKDLLFESQHEWGHQHEPQTAYMLTLADRLGLDKQKFEQDLQSADLQGKIMRDKSDGTRLGVTGTPTFFVNGEVLGELNATALKNLIEKHL